MSKSLSSSLSSFLAANDRDSFDSFDVSPENDPNVNARKHIRDLESMEEEDVPRAQKSKKEKEDDPFQDTQEFLDDNYSIFAEDFDEYVDEFLLDGEDEEFRQSLIAYGRKFQRNGDGNSAKERSELEKAYSKTEKALNDLMSEISTDKNAVQADINKMRTMRTRSYKTLSELIESKNTLHNSQLQIIKELNSITKNKFDLEMKAAKQKEETEADDSQANKMIQSLFGVGRGNLVGSYSDISGSAEAGTSMDEEDDDYIERTYLKGYEDDNQEGDRFLEYEGLAVDLYLEYDDNGPIQIVAEDADGNVLPDYPVPDIDNLEFEFSENTGTATDNLSQQYKLRRIE